MRPLTISIVITNYNYARFLRSSVDSALSQTYRPCEVVVVDDGSTDGSQAVIASYGDRVKAVYKANGGQGSALNAGFAASRGDLVIFLDADDVLLPEALETVASQLRDGIGFVRYPLEVIDAEGNTTGALAGAGGSRLPSAIEGPFGVDAPGSAKAFPREILQRLMPLREEESTMCADAYLAALASVLGAVVCLDKVLGQYRVHGANHVAGVAGGLAEVRRSIVGDFNLHRSLKQLLGNQIADRDQWLGRYPQHWFNRIKSLRESPLDHNWPDNISYLLKSALFATYRHPYWNLPRKLAFGSWIICFSICPVSISRKLQRSDALRRNRFMRLLVG